MAITAFKGSPVNTIGDLPAIGATAPSIKLVANDLATVTLDDFAGKRKVLSIVPSLDTPVCAASARHFNADAASLANTVVLVISADLPFAQKRFCTTEGLEDVITLSMMRGRAFAKAYGVLMVDGPLEGLCARAVVVLDEANTVIHRELVPEITSEPDYPSALQILGG